MNQLMFQASRRHLCALLSKEIEKTTDPTRVENLGKILEAADGEVRRLEYWSDLKDIAVEGNTMTIDTDETGESGGKGKARMP